MPFVAGQLQRNEHRLVVEIAQRQAFGQRFERLGFVGLDGLEAVVKRAPQAVAPQMNLGRTAQRAAQAVVPSRHHNSRSIWLASTQRRANPWSSVPSQFQRLNQYQTVCHGPNVVGCPGRGAALTISRPLC